MSSLLAKLRFIADSFGNANYRGSFRGSNPHEQNQIEMIREVYAPWLYGGTPPQDILDELGPIAEKLIADTKMDDGSDIDDLLSMYEL